MTPGVRKSLVGSTVLTALIAAAGCSHYLVAERDAWRHEAEESCINSGVPEETPGRVRISTISGPGACGIDYPLKVSELGLNTPLGYDDEPLQPPASIPDAPNASMPQHWPVVQSQPLPPPPPEAASPQEDEGPDEAVDDGPPPYDAAPYGRPPSGQPQYSSQPYGQPQYGSQPYRPPSPAYGQPSYNAPQYGASQYSPPPPAAAAGAPMSLAPPGVAPPDDDAEESGPESHPYYNVPNNGAANPAPVDIPPSLYSPRPMMAPPSPQPAVPAAREEPIPPLGPPTAPVVTASAGAVQVKPAATLACPLVSALDKWISAAVQPAALKWFRQPVVEIKQIGSYSCRAMVNGNPNAPISEHAFGNALDIAEFDLADGRKISVQYGWRGTPEEQGFLRDVQGAACANFTTVLAPGANVYHYNHIHVDLMRRRGRPYICEPSAVPGDVVAARARAHYAAQHYGAPGITGSIKSKQTSAPFGYSADDDDHLPLAVPGDD